MSPCTTIDREEVRAEVWMGTALLAKTPFIKSFNVSKSRNQLTNTFNITFEMIAGTAFPLLSPLEIKAGTKGNLKTIFTGLIESTTAQPAFGKPSYFSITLGGRGVLSGLENKKFSRRLKSDGQGLFCLITGGSKNRPQSYYNLDKRIVSGNHTSIVGSPNPARTEGENSPYVKFPDSGANQATGGLPSEIANRPSGGGEGTGDAFRTHTHENMDEGGPAFATYSSD
jgi:hypothetical protein